MRELDDARSRLIEEGFASLDYLELRHAETLRQLVQPGDLKLISSTSCLFCTRARQYLTEQRIPFEECFIERDSACLAEYRARGAAGTPTVLVRGQARLGFDPGQVAETLAAAR